MSMFQSGSNSSSLSHDWWHNGDTRPVFMWFNGRGLESVTNFPRNHHGALHSERISICSLPSAASDAISHGTSTRGMDLFRHWSFCSGASPPSPEQSCKRPYRPSALLHPQSAFCSQRKWGNGPSSSGVVWVWAGEQNGRHLVLSSSPWQRGYRPKAHHLWKSTFPAYIYTYIYICCLCRFVFLQKHKADWLFQAFLIHAFNRRKEEATKQRSSASNHKCCLSEMQHCELPLFLSHCSCCVGEDAVIQMW